MTDQNETGGPAFPNPALADESYRTQPGDMGMTLRDWFASNAPFSFRDACDACGFLDYQQALMVEDQRAAVEGVLAMLRFSYADAMIAARKGGAA